MALGEERHVREANFDENAIPMRRGHLEAAGSQEVRAPRFRLSLSHARPLEGFLASLHLGTQYYLTDRREL